MEVNEQIAKYLKCLARIEADKQIAYLKCQIKDKERIMKDSLYGENLIPLKEKVNLYKSKIKEYESYFI